MNRNEEFSKLLEDVENLNYDNHQNIARAITRNKRHQFVKKTSLSLLTTFTLFTVLVNTFPSVAYAASQIPILKELAEAVQFSKSLETAIENEYIQHVGITQTQGDITLTVEYVIVENEQLHVFYTANDAYHEFNVSPSMTSQNESGKRYSMTSPGELDNEKLMMLTIDGLGEPLGTDVQLKFSFYPNESSGVPINVEDALLEPQHSFEGEVATLTFDLELDPTLIAQEVIIQVNEEVVINNQKLMIESIEVHPTRMLVHVREDETNTKKLSTLTLTVRDQSFKWYEAEHSGFYSFSKEDDKRTTYVLETNYFNPNNKLTKLKIHNSAWYDESEGHVKLNLKNPELSELPTGVEIVEISGSTSSKLVTLKFIEDQKNGIHFEWRQKYYDKNDQMYEIMQWVTRTDEEGNTIITCPIDGYTNGETIGYTDDEVWLVIDKIETIDEKVSIELKK